MPQHQQAIESGERQFLVQFGERLKKLRKQKGMKQFELAARCNIDGAGLSRIESGEINITIVTLKKICSALEVPVSELLSIPSSDASLLGLSA